MECAFDLSGVTKRFGATVAVDDLALRLEPGVFVGLLGRNGAGKTTTINMCMGLLEPSSGSIRVLGIDVVQDPLAVKRRVGVMAQDEGFLDYLTGPQYLHFVGRVYGLDDQEIRKRSEERFDTLWGLGASGTAFMVTTGVGQVFSVRFPRAIEREGASQLPLYISWIPTVLLLLIGTVLYAVGAMPLAHMAFLGLSILAYIRLLPLIAAQVERHQELLLRM